MNDLIARLEKGPDRNLDGDVAVACSDLTGMIQRIGKPSDGWCSRPSPNSGVVPAPQFTSSVDAALTLVPDGWMWSLEEDHEEISRWFIATITPINRTHELQQGTHDLPAIAMCIAALKARAAYNP